MLDELQDNPGAIAIMHSEDTLCATVNLLELILETDGSPDNDEFIHRKHCLFLAVLQAGDRSESKVACPTDQALIARSLLGSGQWRNAASVRSEASCQMWCFRAIDAHACRLALHNYTHYKSLSAMDALPAKFGPADLAAFEELFNDISNPTLVEEMERAADLDDDDAMDDDSSDDSDGSDEDRSHHQDAYGIPQREEKSRHASVNLRLALEHLSTRLETPCNNQALHSDGIETRGTQTIHA